MRLVLVFVAFTLASQAQANNCAQSALRGLLERRSVADVERNLLTSRLTPEGGTGMSGNGARVERLEDGSRVITKPSVIRHHLAGEVRSGDYEIAAGIVDRQLGLNSAPVIVEREVDGVRRTVQVFVEDARLGGSSTWNPDELGFYDYLIRNQDRSFTNYMNTGGRPVAIDNAFSFTNAPLVARAIPDYPRIVRDLVSRARSSPEARARLRTLLPNDESYRALVETSPAEWRRLLGSRLTEPEMQAFLQRRADVLSAIADARRSLGDDVMRNGNEPAQFAAQPGRMRQGGGPFDYVPSAPRSGQEAASELNRSANVRLGSGDLQPGRTYQVGILQRNGQMFIGDRLTEGATATGTIRITPDGVVEYSGNARARESIGIALRTVLPPGTRVQPVSRIGAETRRAVERVRTPAAEAASRRTLDRTVSRFTTANVRIRDGGFRGQLVDEPPAPGNYVIVQTTKIRNGRSQTELTLIRETGDVGPPATVRRLRADNEDYRAGHRSAVGNVTIRENGEVTLSSSPLSNAGDLDVLSDRLRSIGIRTN